MRYRIRKGLDLPLAGEPEPVIHSAQPSCVALLGADYVGLRPHISVQAGERVARGQLLFEDGKNPGVRFTSPGAGQVIGIHRGERRVLQSVVIALDPAEQEGGAAEHVRFASFRGRPPGDLDASEVRALLVESGLWTAIRTRPYSRAPETGSVPAAIFVTAIDTQPHAPAVDVALSGREEAFAVGMTAIEALTSGPVYLCRAPGSKVASPAGSRATVAEFSGPHPAGAPGMHIHLLDPVHHDKTVWHVGYQDVAAIGHLLATGRLDVERVVSLAGPSVLRPRLLRTRLGAAVDDLVSGELRHGENRVISGSVLAGRTAMGEAEGYLGRFHLQVSVLAEQRDREALGWLKPQWSVFSVTRAFASSLRPRRRFALTTAAHGAARPMVPIGVYEAIMPMDIEPTFLLRALLTGDLEQAESLGALELDEEDLALCTFVSPGKGDYGPMLRDVLDRLRKEG